MSGHRQAAVALHALAQEDRRLILAQLPESDQSTLNAYLDELKALGFDNVELAPALAPAAVDLASAAPATVFALLEHEPAALVARVLAARPWHWRDAVLAMFTQVRREAIRTAAVAPAPARDRFVLEALDTLLAQDAPVSAQAQALRLRRSSWLSQLLTRMGAWRR